ncbi:nuclear receptor 2C2-associated protein [Halyomorpha halys]|uniref:nuclear receptor 2C2-associated protein n=1 Tax=Halyomorpha halys TaxID=286706 RepID=UPI0006D4FBFA|nr:nuclear receptor 2C2-associated protein [Halyomorpha halys]
MESIESVVVSSVLNKDVKQFGKKNMFDGQDETCWNSDQGSPQWVKVKLKEEMEITFFTIQFQGGFTAKELVFKGESNGYSEEVCFFPEDNNSVQQFALKHPTKLKSLFFKFNSSTDFFGRVIIYKLSWS